MRRYSQLTVEQHLKRHFGPHGLAVRLRFTDLDTFSPWLRRLGRHRPQDPRAGVPVSPNGPGSLSGGAAAEMKFDD